MRDGIVHIVASSIGNGKAFKVTYVSKLLNLFTNSNFEDNEFQDDAANICPESSY